MVRELILLAALSALIAYNITNTKVFEWLRKWCKRCTHEGILAQLVECPYCCSFWTSGLLVLWTGFRATDMFGWLISFLVTTAAVVILAQPFMVLVDWSIEAINSFPKLFRKATRI